MKRFTRSLLSLCLTLLLCAAVLPGSARADGETTGGTTAPASASSRYLVTGYNAHTSAITINQSASIDITLSCIEGTGVPARVVRGVDNFRFGDATVPVYDAATQLYTFSINNLVYTGTGNGLTFTVYYNDGSNQTLNVAVAECVPYTEPEQPDTPAVVIPAPRVIFSSDASMSTIAAGETKNITLYVQNAGTTVMRSPMVSLTQGGALMLVSAQSAYVLDDIRPGQSAAMTVTVKAADKITEESQSLGVKVDFYYDNGTSLTNTSADGSIFVPAAVSEDNKDDGSVASPTPIVILSKYSYGGSSIAAGSSANLSFSFTNTSKTIAIENVMVTVSGGTDLMLNGSTNTFYFDSVAAGGSKSVTVPVKAAQIISASAQNVTIDVKYEYVDHKTRQSNSASLMLSVPLYQPDRFELSEPKTSYVGYVGEETSLTIDYINKGKSAISNVEATISGDVDTYTAYQRIGNIEGGKNGTIAFAVTPQLEGENQVTITITYEDSNGNTKERVFEASVEAMAYQPADPGTDDPGMIDPEEPESTFPWKYVIIGAAVLLIILLIVLRARKKKAKQKAEQALWDKWDEEETADEKKEAAEAKAEYQESVGAGAGEQKK